MGAVCIITVTCGTTTVCTSARVLTTARDPLCTALRFTRGRRRTGISGRGIGLRHQDFGRRYIDRRRVGAGLLVAAADTNRRQTMALSLPAVAEANHPPAITEVHGPLATAQAQGRPAMAVPLDRPHHRWRVPPVLRPAIFMLVFRKAATGHRLSVRLLNSIREPVQAALTAASAENPSVRRAIAAEQAPGAATAPGENSDETA